MKYNKYRIRNTTKNQYEYIWELSTNSEPTASVEYPGDSVDTNQTAIIDFTNSTYNPGVPNLSELKNKRHEEIRNKTDELLESGSFTFGGKDFRLNDSAVLRWIGVGHADAKSMISYPYTVTTKTFEKHDIADGTEWNNFFGTGLGTMEAIENAGRDLHDDIINAVDEAAVNAVVDNR